MTNDFKPWIMIKKGELKGYKNPATAQFWGDFCFSKIVWSESKWEGFFFGFFENSFECKQVFFFFLFGF